ncbi:MAG: DUF3108 domain-containing protein [Muribaculaceae bacterium]|nr:DUF3108 domain-containing protein [Muribaculaceae bacterium]
MRNLLATFIFIVAAASAAYADIPMGESLNYRVMFKWGLVNKQAGHANISTSSLNDSLFRAELIAASEKWADMFFKVRDTLRGNIDLHSCEPSLYEKITHEGGEYKFDRITYERNGNHVVGKGHRIHQKKPSKPITNREVLHEADGFTLDMLSSFYFMRSIRYDVMTPGDSIVTNIFSGSAKEELTITYVGQEDVEIDDTLYPTYHIRFRFTDDGGKVSSDDMDAWISSEPSKIPLKLEGKLVVGKVQCFLIP